VSRYQYSRDENIERAARALERIADTLDDYMEMSLTTGQMARALADDPEKALTTLSDVMQKIRDRRDAR